MVTRKNKYKTPVNFIGDYITVLFINQTQYIVKWTNTSPPGMDMLIKKCPIQRSSFKSEEETEQWKMEFSFCIIKIIK